MPALYGLYGDAETARKVALSLRATGIDPRQIEVVSSVPLEGLDLGGPEARTPMPWLATLGGLIGGLSGYLLASGTQHLYPLVTGGMPIAPAWTNGIITYELTMLGAVVATVITLLLSTHLPTWKTDHYDPAVSEGKILVGVVNLTDDSRVQIAGMLRDAGAEQIREG